MKCPSFDADNITTFQAQICHIQGRNVTNWRPGANILKFPQKSVKFVQSPQKSTKFFLCNPQNLPLRYSLRKAFIVFTAKSKLTVGKHYEAPELSGPGANAPPVPGLIRHWPNYNLCCYTLSKNGCLGLTKYPTKFFSSRRFAPLGC